MNHKQFEVKMREMGVLINVPDKYYPRVGRHNCDGLYVEIDESIPIYRWICIERGTEFKNEIFLNPQDLLYCVFEVITSLMGYDYASRNKKTGQRFRRLAFEHQLDLLGMIDEDFRKRREKEIEEILTKYP